MKKAQFDIASEMPLWFIRIGVLIMILIVIVAGVSSFLTRKIDVKQYESQLIMYDIYNCLSYQNHFGMIDSTKLGNLENCFDFKDLELGLTFTDLDGKLVTEKYINQDKFIRDKRLCNVKMGNEKTSCYSARDYLFLDDKPVIFEFTSIYKEAI
ncbi:hypothetical protein J4404_03690 [Candidatus Woesearchaeota archaeon]|nr:hypothetical protein [Candidatus Woesearchaeota archaeon]